MATVSYAGLHGHNPLEDRRNSRGHMHGSAHSMKGRPVDMDSQVRGDQQEPASVNLSFGSG